VSTSAEMEGAVRGGGDRLSLCEHGDYAETETKIAASFFTGRVMGYGFLSRGRAKTTARLFARPVNDSIMNFF
jgi:hypothetical protein